MEKFCTIWGYIDSIAQMVFKKVGKIPQAWEITKLLLQNTPNTTLWNRMWSFIKLAGEIILKILIDYAMYALHFLLILVLILIAQCSPEGSSLQELAIDFLRSNYGKVGEDLGYKAICDWRSI